MNDFRKWLNISSFQMDRLRIAWAESKSLTDNSVDFIKQMDILWGELHFLFISLNNLFKSIDRFSIEFNEKSRDNYESIKIDIKHLRDIYEHWNINDGDLWSLKQFKKKHKETDPKSIELIDFKSFKAGGVDLNKIQSIILRLESYLDDLNLK